MLNVGVVVGKFQSPYLTDSHCELISHVVLEYDVALIFIGSNQIRTEIDLLEYETRMSMIDRVVRKAKKNAIVVYNEIKDVFNKEKWSKNLDAMIDSSLKIFSEPINVTLIGGRDSFVPHYVGKFTNFENFVSSYGEDDSGTEVRNSITNIANDYETSSRDLENFNAGRFFEAKLAYPTAYQTVDILIVDADGKVLLGRKAYEDKFRFIGGFSEPTSPSLEHDALKEVFEETGIVSSEEHLSYIYSTLVKNDPRRLKSMHKNKTALFKLTVMRNVSCKPGDDIVELKWFNVEDIEENMVDSHLPLLEIYRTKGAI